MEFEGTAIYSHKEDFDQGLPENGFWVTFSTNLVKKKDINAFSDKYVIIIGTFKMKNKGHMGMFGGSIENIVRLDQWGL